MVLNLEATQHLKHPGRFDALGVPGLFQLVDAARATGVLRIKSPRASATLWCRHGKIVFIASSLLPDWLSFLLVQHKFMTPTIYQRFAKMAALDLRRQIRAGLARSEWQGLRAAHELCYFTQSYMLTQEERNDLATMATEWQSLQLLGWRTGIFQFENLAMPEVTDELPGCAIDKLLARFEQILTNVAVTLENYAWERALNLADGKLSQVPLPVVLQLLKAAQNTGVLSLRLGWFEKHQLYLRFGKLYGEPQSLRHLLGSGHGRFRFQIKNDVRLPTALASYNSADVYQQFYNPDLFHQGLRARQKEIEAESAPRTIKEVTNFRAWLEIKLEMIWLELRPSLSWFLPLTIPMVLAIIYTTVATYKMENDYSTAQSGQSVYMAANLILQQIASRQITPELGKSNTYRYENNRASITPQASMISKGSSQPLQVKYLIKVEGSDAQVEVEAADLRPSSKPGQLTIQKIK